jgi:hypothetical protein
MTRVEALDVFGQVVGYFFTPLPHAECLRRTRPEDYVGVPGDWVPAGGRPPVPPWCDVLIGEIVEVPDTGP